MLSYVVLVSALVIAERPVLMFCLRDKFSKPLIHGQTEQCSQIVLASTNLQTKLGMFMYIM